MQNSSIIAGATALIGESTAASGIAYGLQGKSNSTNLGTGVVGTSTIGGGYFVASDPNGTAVTGFNT